jgi:hypothetical protein
MITARKPRNDKRKLTPYEFELSQKLREKGKIGGGMYSETTIKNYVSKCRLAFQKCDPQGVFEDIEWTKDFENVKKKLHEPVGNPPKDPSISQLGGFYNSLIMISSLYDDYPSDIMNHYEVIRDSLRNQANTANVAGGSEKKKTILDAVKKDDIEKMLKELRISKERKEFMTWLMMKLTIMFSLRNEIASVKLELRKIDLEEMVEGNWLLKTPKTYYLVRNNYKTSSYGTKVNEIKDKQLIRGLNKWIKQDNVSNNQFLFTAFDQGRKTPLRSYDISHYFGDTTEKYLEHKISSSLLASIYSETPTDLSTATLEDTSKMKKQADNRGHNMKTKLMVYDQNKSK